MGGLIYPPNGGFIRKYSTVLRPPSKIDRYGGKIENGIFKDTGKYFADAGTSFEERALDASTLTNGSHYKVYEIVKPIKVEAGEAIPWFGQAGKGTQYFIKDGVEELVKKGYIKEVIQ